MVTAALVCLTLAAAAYLGRSPSTQVLMLMWGAFLAVVLLRFPTLAIPGLIVAAAFVPFTIGTGTGSQVNVVMLGLAGLAVLWFVQAMVSREPLVRSSIANAPWLALLIVAALSVVAGEASWSPWVVVKSNFLLVQGAQWAVYALSALAFFLGANFVRTRTELQRTVATFLVVGAVVTLTILVPARFPMAGRSTWFQPLFRVWLVSFAGSLAVLDTALRPRLRAGLGALAVLVVANPALVARDWASGWLPSVVAASVIALLWLWERHRAWLPPMTVAVGLLSVVVAIGSRATTRGESWSWDTRIMAWRGLLELMHHRWIFGLGLASYWHYWRGQIGVVSYRDPTTGYLHYSYDPQVNMHNNYVDVFAQMGLVGTAVLAWLLVALVVLTLRAINDEAPGFGRAYASACLAGLLATLFAGLLGDWFLPFVYNIGFQGILDSFIPWLFLGGIVVLNVTRAPSERRMAISENNPTLLDSAVRLDPGESSYGSA